MKPKKTQEYTPSKQLGQYKCPHCHKVCLYVLYKATIKESGQFYDLVSMLKKKRALSPEDGDYDYVPAERKWMNVKYGCPECGKDIPSMTLALSIKRYEGT